MGLTELERLRIDYSGAAASSDLPKGFVCPITLVDAPASGLCRGHILCEGIKQAARTTIPQLAAVDNYFGSTIERPFVDWLNIPVSSSMELIKKSRDLTVTLPDGQRATAFFASDRSRPPYQQISLLDGNGEPLASPFLKDAQLTERSYKQLPVSWSQFIPNGAITGSFVKAAYLAMFRLFGYRWVLHVSGDKVRRVLARFYSDRAGKESAAQYFQELEGCAMLAIGESVRALGDTLTDARFLIHYRDGGVSSGKAFAFTTMLCANGQTFLVTLPFCEREAEYFEDFDLYKKLIANWSLPHSVHLAGLSGEQMWVDPLPLQWRHSPDGRLPS